MAKKTKAQENFESVRSSLFEKYPSGGDSGSGFVTSGNEDFDRLRKQMLEKYSTPQQKTVQSAPDYRRKSGKKKLRKHSWKKKWIAGCISTIWRNRLKRRKVETNFRLP